jgi:hypothetical protein
VSGHNEDEDPGASELGDDEAFEEWDHHEPDDDPFSVAELPPVADDLRPGETLEERNRRRLAQNAREREAERPAGTITNPPPDRLVARLDHVQRRIVWGDEPSFRDTPTRRLIRGSAVKVTDAQGNESWRELGRDEEATRVFVEAHAQERGFTVDELQRPFRSGRPGRAHPRELARRRVLAQILLAGVAAGAKRATLEAVLGHSKQRITELLRRAQNPDVSRL